MTRGDKLQVLIVDDYPDAGDSLALLLRCWGCQVHVARDGPGALAAVRRFQPDVVLLELRLKGMDGFTLARRLREERSDGLQLVAVTGQGDEATRRRAAEHGFALFLVKPGDLEQLHALLNRRNHLCTA
jgi:CheY-like chemotaxis protein